MIYRKYRPTTFAEIAGQEHVVQTLKGALISNTVSHAYMFTGPRGTGKTSMARLLAKAVNCLKRKDGMYEPCNSCENCNAVNSASSLDLIEIDAASNRGIDEIRSIRDAAQVASSFSKYKVFIIDEVHMLTPPAFNALLKVLEEPPKHIIFILATTEAHKVLDTIISRVQRFDFKKINDEAIRNTLKDIAKKEKISIEQEALDALVSYSTGSLRDAQSALAKLMAFSGSTITAQSAQEALGIVSENIHEDLINSIIAKDSKTAISQIQSIYESGANIEQFLKQFISFLHRKLIESIDNPQKIDPRALATMISAFISAKQELKDSPVATLSIELAIIKLCS